MDLDLRRLSRFTAFLITYCLLCSLSSQKMKTAAARPTTFALRHGSLLPLMDHLSSAIEDINDNLDDAADLRYLTFSFSSVPSPQFAGVATLPCVSCNYIPVFFTCFFRAPSPDRKYCDFENDQKSDIVDPPLRSPLNADAQPFVPPPLSSRPEGEQRGELSPRQVPDPPVPHLPAPPRPQLLPNFAVDDRQAVKYTAELASNAW